MKRAMKKEIAEAEVPETKKMKRMSKRKGRRKSSRY